MSNTGTRRARDSAAEPKSHRPASDGAATASGPEAGALDLLLTEAGQSAVARFVPGLEAVRLAGALARRPRAVVRCGSSLATEMAKLRSALVARTPDPSAAIAVSVIRDVRRTQPSGDCCRPIW
jgi:hypothetical protein